MLSSSPTPTKLPNAIAWGTATAIAVTLMQIAIYFAVGQPLGGAYVAGAIVAMAFRALVFAALAWIALSLFGARAGRMVAFAILTAAMLFDGAASWATAVSEIPSSFEALRGFCEGFFRLADRSLHSRALLIGAGGVLVTAFLYGPLAKWFGKRFENRTSELMILLSLGLFAAFSPATTAGSYGALYKGATPIWMHWIVGRADLVEPKGESSHHHHDEHTHDESSTSKTARPSAVLDPERDSAATPPPHELYEMVQIMLGSAPHGATYDPQAPFCETSIAETKATRSGVLLMTEDAAFLRRNWR
ncbi:MAG: hypothetical protein R3A47_12435 [Polyangiales bacterium]